MNLENKISELENRIKNLEEQVDAVTATAKLQIDSKTIAEQVYEAQELIRLSEARQRLFV